MLKAKLKRKVESAIFFFSLQPSAFSLLKTWSD